MALLIDPQTAPSALDTGALIALTRDGALTCGGSSEEEEHDTLATAAALALDVGATVGLGFMTSGFGSIISRSSSANWSSSSAFISPKRRLS